METFSYPVNDFGFSQPPFYDNFLQPWSIDNQPYDFTDSFSSDIKIQNLDPDPKIEPPSLRKPSHSPSIVEVKAEDPKSTRSRKKRKRTENEENGGDISFVSLSREELLEMSSQELEDRVKLLQQQRALTVAEKEEIQRQRKLIKNREYAQTSRLKKRETLTTLKGQLEELTSHNVVLQTQVNHLTQRNRELELENQQLRILWNQTTQTFVPMAPIMTPTYPLPPAAVVAPTVIPHSPEMSSYSETGSPSSPPSTDDYDSFLGSITSDSDDVGSYSLEVPLPSLDTPLFPNTSFTGLSGGWGLPNPYTSICLLVILFSFGLFFNFGGLPGQGALHSGFTSHSTARMLKENDSGEGDDSGEGNTDILFGLEDGLDGLQKKLNFVNFGSEVVLNVTKEMREGKQCPGMMVVVDT